jgi:hypothetical protein
MGQETLPLKSSMINDTRKYKLKFILQSRLDNVMVIILLAIHGGVPIDW